MPSDYRREDENEVTPHRIKSYGANETIIEVAANHGLRCERVSHPAWDFCVIRVWATKKDFKRAQLDWLARMIAQKHEMEIEL